MKKALLFINFLCVIGYSQPEYTYVQVDPPTQPTATGVSFYAINDSGVVAARAYGNQTQRWHILRWSEDGGYSVAYNAPTTDVSVDPTSINNLGTITAIRSENIGIIILSNGSTFTLPFTSGQGSYAYDSNILDQVVGRSLGSAVLWENGNINNITPGTAFAINDLEDIALIVPVLTDGGGGSQTVLHYANGTSTILNFPVEYGTPYSLNNNREIVGQYNQNTSVAFYWSEQTGVVDLPGLPGFTSAAAVAINDSGIIVGHVVYPGDPSRAVVWYKNDFGVYVIKDINDYVPVGFGEARWAEDINNAGVIVGTIQTGSGARGYLLKPPEFFEVTRPVAYDKWIAGETDTIKWTGGQAGQLLQIEFSVDSGNTFEVIDYGIKSDTGVFAWNIPEDILSKKCMIRIFDMTDTTIVDTSDIFKIKGYILTRDSSGQYEPFRTNQDQWGFKNDSLDCWNYTWYQQFDYRGIDPYTNSQYSQWQGWYKFKNAKPSDFPDWISWVDAFTVDACYHSTSLGIYDAYAIKRWAAAKVKWKGSCFGIAAVSSLAFTWKDQFQAQYPNYPQFQNPNTVNSNDAVKKTVNELFSHQYGNPSKLNDIASANKTPNQTLNELKQMLLEDDVQPRTISIYKRGNGGAHTILPYRVRQDANQKHKYYVDVYDNQEPESNNPITIDTTGNNNNGTWSTPDRPGWNGKFYLEITSDKYLNNATLPKGQGTQSPFIFPENILEINYPSDSQIEIKDLQGNATGFVNNQVLEDIPGSLSQMIKNGAEMPPYGYLLQTDNYSVTLNAFESDTVETYFFKGNKSFVYERSGAVATQTDRLFFDGGISAVNPDPQIKSISLLNLINETTQEKLFSVRSLELAPSDSVKIENPDSSKLKLISYGSAKDYDIELNYVTENGIGRFGDFDVPLSANTSHTFVPDWSDITNTDLMVLVDNGNNGTIDDTLYLQNQVTGIDNDQGSLLSPNSYNLAQNYPNPFNPSTSIQYAISNRQFVSLKVYDVLGNEIATLVNEEKDRGVYIVNFDATLLASGMYLYRLQAGSFIETRKMILIK